MQDDKGLVLTVKDGMRIHVDNVIVQFFFRGSKPALRFIAPKETKICRDNAKVKTRKVEGIQDESKTKNGAD